MIGRDEDGQELPLQQSIGGYLAECLGASSWRLATFHRSVEGFSWETYSVGVDWADSASRRHSDRFIVHRVPEAGLLRPYSARRLFDLRVSVAGIEGVPVPDSLWIDEAGTATGRPLYVVEAVEGHVPTQWSGDGFFEDPRVREQTASQLMGIAAALHSAPLGLAQGGVRGSEEGDPFAEVRYWYDVYTSENLGPEPIVDLGFAWLFAHQDDHSGRLAILHGDFRTGNYIVRNGRIVAMLDWEECHVGDPVQDLAHCALRLFRGRRKVPSGLLPLKEMLQRYEAVAGWRVPRESFHFWTVFESVYTAVTMHRAAAIFAARETNDVRYAALGTQAHYNHRLILDAIEDAESGSEPS